MCNALKEWFQSGIFIWNDEEIKIGFLEKPIVKHLKSTFIMKLNMYIAVTNICDLSLYSWHIINYGGLTGYD